MDVRNFLPNETGVYIFKDAQDNILYIGKAKSLKKRVNSYFASKNKDNKKISSLIKDYHHIEHIVTTNETAALLLEVQLIQKYKPRYNILLKEGQPYLYILFTQEIIPKIKIVRLKKENGSYYGPFLEKKHVRQVYNFLVRTFRLSLCNKKIEEGCLDYHLDICAGNCKKDFDLEEYKFRLQLAEDLLHGKYKEIEKNILERIKFKNARLEFEKSKNLYSYLENIKNIYKVLETKKYKKVQRNINFQQEDLTKLKKLIGMEKLPIEIDCFDISHFQSSYIVGSCIRFKNGKPDPSNFRKFKIKTLLQQNDYKALEEIVKRRYKNENDLPDLILIDGGKGQLNAVKKLYPNVEFVSLAKKEETLFGSKLKNGGKLDLKSNFGRLLIALRDYAHHFAISYHRSLRSKNLKGG
jgi:excinuclease ABC subunit C